MPCYYYVKCCFGLFLSTHYTTFGMYIKAADAFYEVSVEDSDTTDGRGGNEEYVETCERYARLCLKIGIMLDSLQQYGDAMHYIEIAEREINRCYPGEKPVFIKCIQTAVVCLVQ